MIVIELIEHLVGGLMVLVIKLIIGAHTMMMSMV